MNTIVAISFLVIAALLTQVSAYSTKCKEIKLDISDKRIIQSVTCLKKSVPDAKDFQAIDDKNLACYTKCTMKEWGLMDDEGKPLKANIDASIDKMYKNAELKSGMKVQVNGCLDKHEKSGNGGKATPECGEVKELATCIHDAFKQLCGEKHTTD